MRKWIILLILIVIGIIAYNYIYKDHRDIENEQAEYVLNSTDLANEFMVNPSASEKKYLNKTIEISGTVTELNVLYLTMDGSIFCQFNSAININSKSAIRIKGRFIGYDDLLEEIKLDQCVVVN